MPSSVVGDDHIHYKKGYKYQLTSDVNCYSFGYHYDIFPDHDILLSFINFNKKSGDLIIKEGYAWDGPSGPAFDTKKFMRPSLVHDALYQLIRLEKLPLESRRKCDMVMYCLCLDNGMSKVRSWYCYKAVRLAGKKSATVPRKIYTAP